MRGRHWILGVVLSTWMFSGVPATAQEQPQGAAPGQSVVIPGWGTFRDRDGDCHAEADGEQLVIEVPGTPHDLSIEQGIVNAPVVLQEANGDWTLQVKVSGTFRPGNPNVTGRRSYQGAGLLVAANIENYIRLERGTYLAENTGEHVNYVNFEVRLDGQLVRLGQATDYQLKAEQDVYLKMTRRGEKFSGSVSHDGAKWHELGDKPLTDAPKLFVGVAAINASTSYFAPEFSGLKLTQQNAAE